MLFRNVFRNFILKIFVIFVVIKTSLGLKWQPLNVALARTPDSQDLPDYIKAGLTKAVESLNKFIFVRIDENETMQISKDRIVKCSQNDKFSADQIIVEKFIKKYGTKKIKMNDETLDLGKSGINFVLFLTLNSVFCQKDPFMLAGAAPCMEPNGRLSPTVPRPICGKLIVCLKNPSWKTFASSFDLFRHEIMHALGFGTIIPDKYGNSTDSVTKRWNNNDGVRPNVYQVHYMDFATKATEAARKYFDCDSIVGIEADTKEKIHLSEYIYGDELMTPIVSNGPNYLTYLSASILEATHLGKTPWYRMNRTTVKNESRHYWYGRGWGCSFALGSCYDFMKDPATEMRGTAFPFCDEDDLKDYLYTRRPKKVCFSNGNETTAIWTTCHLMKSLVQPIGQFKPRTLLTQFPRLRRLLDTVGFPVYGSDSFHRYCPMVKEFVKDNIKKLPRLAEVVACP